MTDLSKPAAECGASAPQRRSDVVDVHLARLDHRLGVAARRAHRREGGRRGVADLLAAGRRDHHPAGAGARRARRGLPARGRHRPVPAPGVRHPRGLHRGLGGVAAGRHDRADRGRGGAVLPRPHLARPRRRERRAGRQRPRPGRGAHARLHAHQPGGRELAGGVQQGHRHLEDRRAAAHDRRADRRLLPRQQLRRGRRLRPLRRARGLRGAAARRGVRAPRASNRPCRWAGRPATRSATCPAP